MESHICKICKEKEKLISFNCNHSSCQICFAKVISFNKSNIFASVGQGSLTLNCLLCENGKLSINKHELSNLLRDSGVSPTNTNSVDKAFFEFKTQLNEERGNFSQVCESLMQTVNCLITTSMDKYQKLEDELDSVKELFKYAYHETSEGFNENLKEKFVFKNEVTKSLINLSGMLDEQKANLAKADLCVLSEQLKYQCTNVLEGHSSFISSIIQLDNGLLASAGGNTIKLWDPKQNFTYVRTLEGHSKYIYSLIQLKSGIIASASKDSTIILWDKDNNYKSIVLSDHTDTVYSVIELHDRRLASRSDDKSVKIWDTETNKCITSITKQVKFVNNLLELKDGDLLTTSGDYNIRIWDKTRQFRTAKTLQGHVAMICVVIQLIDETLVSSSADSTIRLWDRYEGTCISVLSGHESIISCLIQLQPALLVSGDGNGLIKVWDLNSNTCFQTIDEHAEYISHISPLRDGKMVSASGDRTMRIWDVKNGLKCLKEIKGYNSAITCLIEIEEGIVAASQDKLIRIYK
jgi:WD40 repeat protein